MLGPVARLLPWTRGWREQRERFLKKEDFALVCALSYLEALGSRLETEKDRFQSALQPVDRRGMAPLREGMARGDVVDVRAMQSINCFWLHGVWENLSLHRCGAEVSQSSPAEQPATNELASPGTPTPGDASIRGGHKGDAA
jgi:hypothetical protein